MRRKIDLKIKITDEIEKLVFCNLKEDKRVKLGNFGVFEMRIQKGRTYKSNTSDLIVRRRDHKRVAFIPSTTIKREIK